MLHRYGATNSDFADMDRQIAQMPGLGDKKVGFVLPQVT